MTSAAGTTTTAPPTSQAPTPTATPRAPLTFEVPVQGNAFVGGTFTIKVGDTVQWVHRDGTVPRSVTAEDGSFDSSEGLPCPGPGRMTRVARSTFSHTFATMGMFGYYCEVHPSMTGTVTVE